METYFRAKPISAVPRTLLTFLLTLKYFFAATFVLLSRPRFWLSRGHLLSFQLSQSFGSDCICWGVFAFAEVSRQLNFADTFAATFATLSRPLTFARAAELTICIKPWQFCPAQAHTWVMASSFVNQPTPVSSLTRSCLAPLPLSQKHSESDGQA